MARANRNYPSVYFGRPGALVTLPWPRGEISKDYDRAVYDFETGAGEHIVSSLPNGAREFTITWNALHVDNYALLEQFWTGMMGQGPWVFIDPTQTNLLRPNQSSTTNLYRDTRQFTVNSLGTLSSNNVTTHIHRTGATRSLRWLWTSAPGATFPVLSNTPAYRSWYGVPVVPGQSYTFSCWMKPDGTVDTSITCAVKLTWVNSAGSQLSESSGGDNLITAWSRQSVIGTAPAGAAFAKPILVVTGSSVLAGGSLYIDEMMMEQDTVLNPWAPGTGLRPVAITGFSDNAPFDGRFRRDVSLTLQEVAA